MERRSSGGLWRTWGASVPLLALAASVGLWAWLVAEGRMRPAALAPAAGERRAAALDEAADAGAATLEAPARARASDARDEPAPAARASGERRVAATVVEACEPDEAILRVLVRTPEGWPAGLAHVELVELLGSARDRFSAPRPGQRIVRTADADGRAGAGVAPGRWRVSAWGVLPKQAQSGTEPRARTELSLRSGETHELVLDLSWTCTVRGHVRDAETGLPVVGAEVWGSGVAREDGVQSGPRGEFALALPFAQRVEWVLATAEGYAFGTGEVRSFEHAEVELVASKQIVGRLATPLEKGALRARIVARSCLSGLPDRAELVVDASGGFEAGPLRSDLAHLVVLEAEGRGRWMREIPPQRGRVDLGTIVLEPEAILEGELVRAEPAYPWRGSEARVQLLDPLAPGGISCGVDESGRFRLDELRPGRWKLEIVRGSEIVHERELWLASGENRHRIVVR